MLAKLKVELISQKTINHNMSSLFHGVLMEMLSEEYADKIHGLQLNPYSLNLSREDDIWYLTVNTLDKAAYDNIINPLMTTDSIYLKHRDMTINFGEKKLSSRSKKSLMEDFYNKKYEKFVDIYFISPTVFKQSGSYTYYPDIRCIFQSVMNKYSSSSEMSMTDLAALDEIIDCVRIASYNIRTVRFHLEKVAITGFIGRVTIRIDSGQTLINFINMLLEFGTYSGIGAKCSLGMGGIAIGKEAD